MRDTAERVDELDAGRDPVAAGDLWRRLPPGLRRGLPWVLAALLVAGVALAGLVERDRRRAERARAAAEAVVDLRAALAASPVVLDRDSLGFRVAVTNRGPLPVALEEGYVGLAGVGLLDARLDALVLPAGEATLLGVRWGFPACGVLPAPDGTDVTTTGLHVAVRTIDGTRSDRVVPLPDVAPAALAAAQSCPRRDPAR